MNQMINGRMERSINLRHGGPYDRGAADSYYGRDPVPHYFLGDTYTSPKVDKDNMTHDEIDQYMRGFNDNEIARNFKDWD